MPTFVLLLLFAITCRAQTVDGKVLQVVKGGVLVDTTPTWYGVGPVPETKIVFVANPPGQNSLVDGDRVSIRANQSGRYQYTAVSGGTKTIDRYESVDVAKERAEHEVMQKEYQDYVNKMRAAAAKKEKAERIAQIRRVIAFQQQQASNGFPSFQLEMAKRYLKGDGVETNLVLARHWLISACTNHDSQASNLLNHLNASE